MSQAQIIPGNISKMQNRVIGPLTFRDIGVIMGSFGLAVLVFFIIPLDGTIGMLFKGLPAVLVLAIGLGIGFLHFLTDIPPIEEYFFTWLNYKNLPKKMVWKKEIVHASGYYASDSTQSFFPFEINKEGILLYHDDGGGAILLKVEGVDYQLLSVDERNVIIATFGDFLDTLKFPIQILTKTTPLDLRLFEGNATLYIEQNKQYPGLKSASEDYLKLLQNYNYADFIYNKNMYIVIPYTREADNAGNASMGMVSNASNVEGIRGNNPINNILKGKTKDNSLDLSALQAKEFSKEQTIKTLKDRANIVQQFLDGLQGVNCRKATLPEYVELFYYFFNINESNIRHILSHNPTDNIASSFPGYADIRESATEYKTRRDQEQTFDINNFL